MKSTYCPKATLLCSTALIAGLTLVPVEAAHAQAVIEEIIVTAQSREQSLQETPISVTAVSGFELQEANIQKVEDLQFSVPNFTMTETGISTNIFIRGIGSGINQAFEQSVGYYVDGVNYPRAQQTRAPFLDLERVEVLRGPQLILFGKNSVAGALSIITAKPSDEFEGYFTTTYEFGESETINEGAVSGPLTDRLRARVAARYRDADGYVRNLTLNRNEPKRTDWTIRGTAEYDVTEDIVASFKVEFSDFDVTGRQIETLNEKPATAGPFAGLTYGQFLVGGFGAHVSALNNTLDRKRSSNGDSSKNEQQSYVLNVDWNIGDYELKSISAFSNFESNELCDCDYTGANAFLAGLQEDYDQFSQEVRLTSPIKEQYDFVSGVYFQTSDHNYADQIIIQPTSMLVPAINAQSPGAGSLVSGTQAGRKAVVKSDLFSAFAQVNVRPIDKWELQIGGRVSHEKKSGTRTLSITAEGGGSLPAAQIAAPTVYAGLLDIASTNLASLGPTGAFLTAKLGALPVSDSLKETRFAPDIKLVYEPMSDLLLYASWARGYKSGGFDFRANNRGVSPTMKSSFVFKDEQANNYEIGAKSTLLGGAAEFNISGFFTKFNDLQISIFDGSLGFNVGNAASAEVMGVEMDGRWRLHEYLSLSGSLAIMDFEFKDFRNGQCYFGQQPNVDLDADGELDLCDYTGKTNQLVSDVQGTIALAFNYPIADGYRLNSEVDMFFTSKYHASNTFDPDLIQGGYATFNARIGVGSDNGSWQVAFIAHNLTNKKFIQFGGDTPLSGGLFGMNSDYAFTDRGRTLGLQARVNF
ncbi:MAG TPA: TonB-dependent receptor [Rhodospirillaceae bacterium]|nr:TonB-dependent receptor [Candidatus Neomarinimicrobiota bacterium]HCX13985.1 TonB-dependent receptor [Rhodospirillaceae bacterium]